MSGVEAECFSICPEQFAVCTISGGAHLIIVYACLADRAHPAVALHLHPSIEARPAVEVPAGSRRLWSGQTLGLLSCPPPSSDCPAPDTSGMGLRSWQQAASPPALTGPTPAACCAERQHAACCFASKSTCIRDSGTACAPHTQPGAHCSKQPSARSHHPRRPYLDVNNALTHQWLWPLPCSPARKLNMLQAQPATQAVNS